MMTPTINVARLLRRRRCHGSFWCCQYVDQAMCNSWNDPHRFARKRYRRQRWWHNEERPTTRR